MHFIRQDLPAGNLEIKTVIRHFGLRTTLLLCLVLPACSPQRTTLTPAQLPLQQPPTQERLAPGTTYSLHVASNFKVTAHSDWSDRTQLAVPSAQLISGQAKQQVGDFLGGEGIAAAPNLQGTLQFLVKIEVADVWARPVPGATLTASGPAYRLKGSADGSIQVEAYLVTKSARQVIALGIGSLPTVYRFGGPPAIGDTGGFPTQTSGHNYSTEAELRRAWDADRPFLAAALIRSATDQAFSMVLAQLRAGWHGGSVLVSLPIARIENSNNPAWEVANQNSYRLLNSLAQVPDAARATHPDLLASAKPITVRRSKHSGRRRSGRSLSLIGNVPPARSLTPSTSTERARSPVSTPTIPETNADGG